MQENVVFIETYFGLDSIEGVNNLLKTGILTTNLKYNNVEG